MDQCGCCSCSFNLEPGPFVSLNSEGCRVPPPLELELSPSLELGLFSFLEAFGHMSSTRMDCMPLPASQLPHSFEQPLTTGRSSAALAALLFNPRVRIPYNCARDVRLPGLRHRKHVAGHGCNCDWGPGVRVTIFLTSSINCPNLKAPSPIILWKSGGGYAMPRASTP